MYAGIALTMTTPVAMSKIVVMIIVEVYHKGAVDKLTII